MNTTTDSKDRLPRGPAANVVARYQGMSGQTADVVLLGQRTLVHDGKLDLEHLVRRTNDLALNFPRRSAMPLAIVGIGFGTAIRGSDYRIWKGEFNEADHPRSPESGEFVPKNDIDGNVANDTVDNAVNQTTLFKDLTAKMQKRIARKVLKNRLIAGLRVFLGIAADAVPVAGEIFDGYEVAQTVIDASALESEIAAAKTFVAGGPRTIEELRAAAEERGFSSAAAFKKDVIGKFYGPAGDGYDYHHIVWQGGVNGDNIAPELLHSTENMVRVPRLLHEEITDAYREPAVKYREVGAEDTGESLRQWLDKQSYEVQRDYGLKVMHKLGIVK